MKPYISKDCSKFRLYGYFQTALVPVTHTWIALVDVQNLLKLVIISFYKDVNCRFSH